MMNQPQAATQPPSEKERKYDRQLRLWAARGQAALESAHVVLINTARGIVGIEAIKNIVLPGVGRFTIIDESTITEADLGANFFLDESSLGKPRAACSAEFLSELNPDVQGDWYLRPNDTSEFDKLLKKLPPITVILYTLPIERDSLSVIRGFQDQHKVPVISMHSVGFYSYFRVAFPGLFPIVETHPDASATVDLRLLSPWEELSQFALEMTQNINRLDDHEHGHIPYVALILHFLEEWKTGHGGRYPTTHQQKAAFKKMIENAMRRDVPGNSEENFEEAITMLRRVLTKPTLPSSVRELIERARTIPAPEAADASFWSICQAIGKFYDAHQCLPLPGNLPDMKSQSTVYVKLQTIYKKKAQQDVAEVYRLVHELPSGAGVELEDVELFCRNAAFIRLISPLGASPSTLSELVEQTLEEDKLAEENGMPPSLLPIYLALHAASHAIDAPTRDEILAIVEEAIPKASQNARLTRAAGEVARAKGGELHNISAITGGLVAQELIKIITKQYVPIDNTCIFDGIDSRCQVLRI